MKAPKLAAIRDRALRGLTDELGVTGLEPGSADDNDSEAGIGLSGVMMAVDEGAGPSIDDKAVAERDT